MAEHKEPTLPIMEIFGPTIQGEGIMSGTITHFLRTGGCGLKCSWCDSMFAVDAKRVKAGKTMMTQEAIMNIVLALGPAPFITFTGGDPCMQKNLAMLIDPLHQEGIRIAVETQGQLFPDWLQQCDVITFSPKGPSSGNIVDIRDMCAWLREYYHHLSPKPRVCIKVVIFNEDDFQYALDVYRALSPNEYDAFYFTAGTPIITDEIDALKDIITKESYAELSAMRVHEVLMNQTQLADRVLEQTKKTQFDNKTHVGCQQHVLLWPTKDQGV